MYIVYPLIRYYGRFTVSFAFRHISATWFSTADIQVSAEGHYAAERHFQLAIGKVTDTKRDRNETKRFAMSER